MIKEIIGLGILVSLLHFFALSLSLYWVIDWYDILMHFLGGLLIGLIITSFIRRVHEGEEVLHKKLLFISVIFGVLTIALGWELWEIFLGFTDIIQDQFDTILDVIMGLLGGVLSVLYYYFKYL
jgi:hypothetical protein